MNAILFIPFLIASTETLYLARIRDTLKKSFGYGGEYFKGIPPEYEANSWAIRLRNFSRVYLIVIAESQELIAKEGTYN